jgi:4-diphosphocytidyl-2-C-methyl-D-erythritol kinase
MRHWGDHDNDIEPVKVELVKNIPMEAGLGGGSADAAAFLTGMKRLFSLKMNKKELVKIAKSLGADVVPLLYDGAVLATGIGSNIKKIKTSVKYYIVIIKPIYGVNTKEMYKEYDLKKNKINELDYTDEIINALNNNDINLLKGKLYNVFEDIYIEKDSLNKIKNKLFNTKAFCALLSGSGSSIYGLYSNEYDAEEAYLSLKDEYDAYLCENIN